MLNINVSGSLPQLPDRNTVMQSMAVRLGSDIGVDVAAGGNPAWPDRVHPPGRANLSYISATMQLSSTVNSATASFGGGLVFARVHEFGITIRITPAMVRFFWAKWYETGEEFWKNMAIGTKRKVDPLLFITIPPRPVIPGILSRGELYAKFLGQQLTITHSVPIAQG